VLDQVEERLLAGVDVVEHHRERPLCGGVLERLPKRPGDLFGGDGGAGSPEQRPDRRRCLGVRRLEVELLQHLNHRPVRDSLAVGAATPAHDHRLERSQGLRDQPRLADSRVADDRHQLAALPRQRPLPRLADAFELALAADEARLVAALRRLPNVQEPVGGNGLGLPSQPERFDRLDLDRLANERERSRSEQNLAGLCCLLEARGDVDRVAGRQALLGTGDDDAGVDPDPCL
jgi:hypothetical protein